MAQHTVSVSVLTVSPELGFEPVWSRQHGPAFGAVDISVALGEGHGREHVRHVVALIAQLDLCARLQPQANTVGSVS